MDLRCCGWGLLLVRALNIGQLVNTTFRTAVVFHLLSIAGVCEAETLCTTSERVIFNCSLQNGKKLVSVCSSKQLTKDDGYLQYRFGTLLKTELTYPSTTKGTQAQFFWRYMRGSEGSGGDLSFKNNAYLYTVGRADAYEKTNGMSGGVSGGITISKIVGTHSQHYLKCDGVPEGDFYALEGIVKDEEELAKSR
jgi:hypothetical protein